MNEELEKAVKRKNQLMVEIEIMRKEITNLNEDVYGSHNSSLSKKKGCNTLAEQLFQKRKSLSNKRREYDEICKSIHKINIQINNTELFYSN